MTSMGLLNKKNNIMQSKTKIMSLGPTQVGPEQIAQFDNLLQQIDQIIMAVQQHLATDSLGRTESISAVMTQASGQSMNSQPNQGVPGQAGQPSPNNQMPTGMSNMTNMPGVPPAQEPSTMGTNLTNQGKFI